MGLLNVIRRMSLREKLPIREISRRTGLSRNTIKKYLNSGTVEPTFTVPERPSKLDPFADKLAGWLKTEAGKPRKHRRNLKHLHADLVALGFTGSYNRVAAFTRDWKADRQREQQSTGRGTFVPHEMAAMVGRIIVGRPGDPGWEGPAPISEDISADVAAALPEVSDILARGRIEEDAE